MREIISCPQDGRERRSAEERKRLQIEKEKNGRKGGSEEKKESGAPGKTVAR